ncbi:MAG: hypothetical protein MUF54_22540, partial [Polyangiaceae bacterium]|nr:hypothetical protein [Polyangiaceae bacterium]
MSPGPKDRGGGRFFVTAGVVAMVLTAASAVKHRAALRAVPEAKKALSPLGSWVAPRPHDLSAGVAPSDPAARVEPGPPR